MNGMTSLRELFSLSNLTPMEPAQILTACNEGADEQPGSSVMRPRSSRQPRKALQPETLTPLTSNSKQAAVASLLHPSASQTTQSSQQDKPIILPSNASQSCHRLSESTSSQVIDDEDDTDIPFVTFVPAITKESLRSSNTASTPPKAAPSAAAPPVTASPVTATPLDNPQLPALRVFRVDSTSSLSSWDSDPGIPSDLDSCSGRLQAKQQNVYIDSARPILPPATSSTRKKDLLGLESDRDGSPISPEYSSLCNVDDTGVDDTGVDYVAESENDAPQAKRRQVSRRSASLHLEELPASEREPETETEPACPQSEPKGSPRAWAVNRRDISSLPYFRANQGSSYISDGVAHSYLFDGKGHLRDYIGDSAIIIRAGGSREKDKLTMKWKYARDQPRDWRVTALELNVAKKIAVVILLGINEDKAPAKLPFRYQVLGYFKPTHVWAEKSDGFIVWVYRFEVYDHMEVSWWGAVDKPQTKLGVHGSPNEQACPICLEVSFQLYVQGWICLHTECAMFWRLPDGEELREDSLTYDERFLHQFTIWDVPDKPLAPLIPPLMQLGADDRSGRDTSKDAWSGIVCPKCGMCNMRIHWANWRCKNNGCGFEHSLPVTVLHAKDLYTDFTPKPHSIDSTVRQTTDAIPNYEITRLTLPSITEGGITIIKPSKWANAIEGGPDQMFEELQRSTEHLERRELKTQTSGSVCVQFTANFGQPYKFDGQSANHPYEAAPEAVCNARTLSNWAMKQAYPTAGHKDFNESLELGYFEKQRISYHDDGESGLGPSIVTLSLGSPSTMTFRMKYKYYAGLSAKNKYLRTTPIPGCKHYNERIKANAELDELEKASLGPGAGSKHPKKSPTLRQAVLKRLAELPKELNMIEPKKQNAKPIMKLRLIHGDIVIMHGERIQQYYEHRVQNEGMRRFAITSRTIFPEHLKYAERPKYEVKSDNGTFDGQCFTRR